MIKEIRPCSKYFLILVINFETIVTLGARRAAIGSICLAMPYVTSLWARACLIGRSFVNIH